MPEHILDIVGNAIPELLPARGDGWLSVSWSTDDPDVLHRLAQEHVHHAFEPGEYIVWRDEVRRLSVQVSCIDDDDGSGSAEQTPAPGIAAPSGGQRA